MEGTKFTGKDNYFFGRPATPTGLFGDLNPARRPEVRKKLAEGKYGDKNPSKRLEVRMKISNSVSGPKNHNWIKDRSKLKISDRPFNDPLEKQWRIGVKNRDKWKCKINNLDCNGKVEAHHILPWRDFPELRYNINNGITLCQAHHPRKRAEEKRLVPFFTGLVPVLNVSRWH